MRIIRQVTDEDYSDVVNLLEMNNLPLEGVKEHFKHFFIIKENLEILGCIGLEVYEPDGLIRSVSVSKNAQKQGVGHELVTNIEKYASKLKLIDLYLLTDSAPDFFKKFGYNIIERDSIVSGITNSIEFTQVCADKGVLMKKRI